MPIAAFTSDGLTPAAAISTSASSSRSRFSRNVAIRGSTDCASDALAGKRKTRASTPVRAAVAAAMLIPSGRLARTRRLRGETQHFARLRRRRYLPAELLNDVARLLHHLRVRVCEHALADLHAVFEPDTDMAA